MALFEGLIGIILMADDCQAWEQRKGSAHNGEKERDQEE